MPHVEADAVVGDAQLQPIGRLVQADVDAGGPRMPLDVAQRFLPHPEQVDRLQFLPLLTRYRDRIPAI